MDEQYIKNLEESNDKLQKLAEQNLEFVDLFKYIISKGKIEVVLNGSGDFTFVFAGNMLNDLRDHRIKDIAKMFNSISMKDKQAAHLANISAKTFTQLTEHLKSNNKLPVY